MTLREELAREHMPRAAAQTCAVEVARQLLDPEEAVELVEILDDPVIASAAIARLLTRKTDGAFPTDGPHKGRVSSGAVARHRRRECKCHKGDHEPLR